MNILALILTIIFTIFFLILGVIYWKQDVATKSIDAKSLLAALMITTPYAIYTAITNNIPLLTLLYCACFIILLIPGLCKHFGWGDIIYEWVALNIFMTSSMIFNENNIIMFLFGLIIGLAVQIVVIIRYHVKHPDEHPTGIAAIPALLIGNICGIILTIIASI